MGFTSLLSVIPLFWSCSFDDLSTPEVLVVTEPSDSSTPDTSPAGAEAFDLGLPSGTKWANMNVGATSETDYGLYFAWGDVVGLSEYNWAHYKWNPSGDGERFTKYTGSDYSGLLPEDDATSVNWGGAWRMPTEADWVELINGTNNEWVSNYNGSGISGYKFTSKTDNTKSIFLPAAGYRGNALVLDQGSHGYYWSSSLRESDPSIARYLDFGSGSVGVVNDNRCDGQSVRAVQSN